MTGTFLDKIKEFFKQLFCNEHKFCYPYDFRNNLYRRCSKCKLIAKVKI